MRGEKNSNDVRLDDQVQSDLEENNNLLPISTHYDRKALFYNHSDKNDCINSGVPIAGTSDDDIHDGNCNSINCDSNSSIGYSKPNNSNDDDIDEDIFEMAAMFDDPFDDYAYDSWDSAECDDTIIRIPGHPCRRVDLEQYGGYLGCSNFQSIFINKSIIVKISDTFGNDNDKNENHNHDKNFLISFQNMEKCLYKSTRSSTFQVIAYSESEEKLCKDDARFNWINECGFCISHEKIWEKAKCINMGKYIDWYRCVLLDTTYAGIVADYNIRFLLIVCHCNEKDSKNKGLIFIEFTATIKMHFVQQTSSLSYKSHGMLPKDDIYRLSYQNMINDLSLNYEIASIHCIKIPSKLVGGNVNTSNHRNSGGIHVYQTRKSILINSKPNQNSKDKLNSDCQRLLIIPMIIKTAKLMNEKNGKVKINNRKIDNKNVDEGIKIMLYNYEKQDYIVLNLENSMKLVKNIIKKKINKFDNVKQGQVRKKETPKFECCVVLKSKIETLSQDLKEMNQFGNGLINCGLAKSLIVPYGVLGEILSYIPSTNGTAPGLHLMISQHYFQIEIDALVQKYQNLVKMFC